MSDYANFANFNSSHLQIGLGVTFFKRMPKIFFAYICKKIKYFFLNSIQFPIISKQIFDLYVYFVPVSRDFKRADLLFVVNEHK